MGNWLVNFRGNVFVKSVIAAMAWHLWKVCCDLLFRNIQPNFVTITYNAYCFAKNHSRPHIKYSGQRLLLNNLTVADGLFLFTIACSNSQVYHAGFFCTTANYNVVVAGSYPVASSTCLEAELLALSHTLQFALSKSITVHHIFISNSNIHKVLQSIDHICSWRLQQLVTSSLGLLSEADSPQVLNIPCIWMGPASRLAAHVANLHTITLFIVSRDLPK